MNFEGIATVIPPANYGDQMIQDNCATKPLSNRFPSLPYCSILRVLVKIRTNAYSKLVSLYHPTNCALVIW